MFSLKKVKIIKSKTSIALVKVSYNIGTVYFSNKNFTITWRRQDPFLLIGAEHIPGAPTSVCLGY